MGALTPAFVTSTLERDIWASMTHHSTAIRGHIPQKLIGRMQFIRGVRSQKNAERAQPAASPTGSRREVPARGESVAQQC
jgi:hypothetical protein